MTDVRTSATYLTTQHRVMVAEYVLLPTLVEPECQNKFLSRWRFKIPTYQLSFLCLSLSVSSLSVCISVCLSVFVCLCLCVCLSLFRMATTTLPSSLSKKVELVQRQSYNSAFRRVVTTVKPNRICFDFMLQEYIVLYLNICVALLVG